MSFDVSAEAYGRFMGRYSQPLASQFVALAGIEPGQRVLDVGCGPGALTAALLTRIPAQAVSAIDPSVSFVEAVRERFPEVDVRSAVAEALPFSDDSFDVALAPLVVHFMADPVAGLAEMARVTRPGGVVGACVWDHGGGMGPLSLFWRAVLELDPAAADESGQAGAREAHLAELFDQAGLRSIESTVLTVEVGYASFDEWWEPYEFGVGPAGTYVGRLDRDRRDELRARCASMLPVAPFTVHASAWTVLGRA